MNILKTNHDIENIKIILPNMKETVINKILVLGTFSMTHKKSCARVNTEGQIWNNSEWIMDNTVGKHVLDKV